MARLTLTPQVPLGSHPALPLTANSADLVFTAASAQVDGVAFKNTARQLLFVKNTHASAAGTVTIRSGDYLLGDRDGVVIIAQEQAERVIGLLDEVRRAEAETQAKIEQRLCLKRLQLC